MTQLTTHSGSVNRSAALSQSCLRAIRKRVGHLLMEEKMASMMASTYTVSVDMELSTVL